MPGAPTAAPPPTEPHWNAPSRGSESIPPTPAPGVPVPVGAIGAALAALLLVALLRGTRLSIGLMAGSPDRSAWLMPVLAAAGAVAGLALWGRRPNRSGWLLTGAGALLLAPCAAVLASGTALVGASWQLLIGVTTAPAGALLTVGVLAAGRMLWLWGWNRTAAAVFAGTVLVQLIPAGLLDQQLGAALALESGPASTSGVVAPFADPAFAGGGLSARMAEGVFLAAAIVLVLAGGQQLRREQRLPTWRLAEQPVSGRLLAVGIVATVIGVLPPVWLGVIALRPVPWSESGSHAVEQSAQVALLASGAVLLLTGVALLAAVGRSVTTAILVTAPGLALVGGIAPTIALGMRPSGMLFAAVVLGAAAGVVLATQRFSGIVAAALVLLFAAALIVGSQRDPSLDSGPDRRAPLLVGTLIGVTAIGAIVGSAVRRITGAASTRRSSPTPEANTLGDARRWIGDELVIGVGVLLPLLAGAGGKLVLGLTLDSGGADNSGGWPLLVVVLVLLPVVAAAALTLRTRPVGR